MTFHEAIVRCLTGYTDFYGRATRSEYWWFFLFVMLLSAGAAIIDVTLYYLVSLALLIPLLAAGARRLHDTNRSGWWQLLNFAPLGFVVVLIFLVQQSKPALAEAPSAAQ